MRRPSSLALSLALSLGGVLAQQPAPATPQDPVAALQAALAAQLKQHPFFAEIAFTTDAGHAPFLFYLQRPLRDDPDYNRLVVNSYTPFLNELRRVFRDEYCGGAAAPGPSEAYAIAILASRGIYDDYARSVANEALHRSRAHYDPRLRMAITHQVLFGAKNFRDERESLLHEFVHAMQHACSEDGAMTKPVWFNEGLAEYRSSCTNVASSLREPPLRDEHVRAMAFGYVHPAGKAYALPLADLVAPESYAQVLAAVEKRCTNGPFRADLAMSMFYAQAEMTVRFLHEAMPGPDGKGKYRAGFQRYFDAVRQGASGLQAFQDAFAATTPQALAAIEIDWLRWLSEILNRRFGDIGDLAGGKVVEVRKAVPPPVGFDAATLAWQPAEAGERIAAARALCAAGRYEAALAALPERVEPDAGGDAGKARLQRERDRVLALLALRDAVVAELEQKKLVFQLDTSAGPVRGKFLRRDEDGAVMLLGKEERHVQWHEFGPTLLCREGRRQKRFEGASCATEAFLLWLQGTRRDERSLRSLLDKEYGAMAELRQDLTADRAPEDGAAGVALHDLQQTALPDDVTAAHAALAALQDVAGEHAAHPLFAARKEPIERLARALAERAFSPVEAAAMGIHARVESVEGSRVRLCYDAPGVCPDLDFTKLTPEEANMAQLPSLAYDGPTGVTAGKDHWRLIGSGLLRWAVPLRGPHEVELEFRVVEGQGVFSVILCHRPERHLDASPFGHLGIHDATANIEDQIGKAQLLYTDRKHTLRLVHDGKTLQSFVDGKLATTLPKVGNCTEGELLLLVHSSEPIQLRKLTITGELDPDDPLALRERFVQQALQRLWGR